MSELHHQVLIFQESVDFGLEINGEKLEEVGSQRDEAVDISVGQLTIDDVGLDLPQAAAISDRNVAPGANDTEEDGRGDTSQQSEASSSSNSATVASPSANPVAEPGSRGVVETENRRRPKAKVNVSDESYTLDTDDDDDDDDDVERAGWKDLDNVVPSHSYGNKTHRPKKKKKTYPVKWEVFGPANNPEGEDWVDKYPKLSLWRRISNRKVAVRSSTTGDGLSIIQDKIIRQAEAWALIITILLTVGFCALPKGNFF